MRCAVQREGERERGREREEWRYSKMREKEKRKRERGDVLIGAVIIGIGIVLRLGGLLCYFDFRNSVASICTLYRDAIHFSLYINWH